MTDILFQLVLFSAKIGIVFLFIVLIMMAFFALIVKSKQLTKNKLNIKNVNKKYDDIKEMVLRETSSKKEFKQFLKEKKSAEKHKAKPTTPSKKIYVLNFFGDIKAQAVSRLAEEITAVLNVANQGDEVVLKLESAGGVVHGYGLAAAQLMRLRARHIYLTVTVDKIAASGGYMMACIANKVLAAPFAIIGSIGVIIQLPNFHRLLKDKHIDFEQLTAGEHKRTLTLFGENTKAGREKLQHDIEDVHTLFKNLIAEHRQQVNIEKVATGEHWLGQQALSLNLVDEIKTSDDYLLDRCRDAHLYEIGFEGKKPLLNKLIGKMGLQNYLGL